MLRVSYSETRDGESWCLQGRLAGPWVETWRGSWRQARERAPGARAVVDLRDVVFIDQAGEALLAEIAASGAEFLVAGVENVHLVESLVPKAVRGPLRCALPDSGAREGVRIKGLWLNRSQGQEEMRMNASPTRQPVPLSARGPEVFPIGLGCMALSGSYGPTSEQEGVATIQAALDHGVNLIDTGDFYGMGHNELLVGRALGTYRDRALVSVKFGALRGPDGAFLGFDARPNLVKTFAAYSLRRLGVDVIDIYRPSRLDPAVPIEETIGAIAELIEAGYVRYIGLSEVGAETIRRAHAVHPIVDLQIEYSLVSRGAEQNLFPLLEELGIGATLYGVLSRGLLSGSKPGAPGDLRAAGFPRFAAAHFPQNEAAVAPLAALAAGSGRTAAQLALAWVLAKQPRLVPLAGARTRAQLADLLRVLERPLSSAEVAEVEAVLPASAISGTRYQAVQMAHLDSEP